MTLKTWITIKAAQTMHTADITAAYAHAAGYKTAAALKSDLRAVAAKRKTRAAYGRYAGKPWQNRSTTQYAEKAASRVLRRAGITPANCKIHACYGDKPFGIDAYREQDWDGYARSCSYPMTVYIYHVDIPRGGIRVDATDGVCLVYARSHTVGDITAREGVSVSRGRALDDVRLAPCTLVRDTHGISAHGDTRESAMRAYRRKLRAQQAKVKRRISPDKVIGARDYMRITGACEPGTRAFCRRHGLDFDTVRMTVREAVELTRGEYGHTQLVAAAK